MVSELALEVRLTEHTRVCTQRMEAKEILVPQVQIILPYKIIRPQYWGLIYLCVSPLEVIIHR